jgi:hypothetical protein
MSNEGDEILTTGPFDEAADEHERDYSDHHHHHQNDQDGGNGWNQEEKQEQEVAKQEEPSKRNLYVSNLSFEVMKISSLFPSSSAD